MMVEATNPRSSTSGEHAGRIGVLFVSHTAHLGGAEVVLQRFLRRVSGFNYLVLIPDGPFADSLAAAGVPFLLSRRLGNLRRDANVLWPFAFLSRFVLAQFELLYWLRCLRPRVVQCNNYVSVVYALLPALLLRTPIVWHMHDIIAPGRVTRWLLRTMSAPVSRIIAVSDAVRRNLIEAGVDQGKVVTIYNGIDGADDGHESTAERKTMEAFVGSFQIVIGVMGAITSWKGTREALEAFHLLTTEWGVNAGLMIAGQAYSITDRKYESDLHDYVAEHGLRGRVLFLGQIRETRAFYESLDVFVHYPVLPDPLPTVILEAIQAGCPVVAAEIGGVPECVGDGRWGRLVPPGDARALARILAEALPGRLSAEALVAFKCRFSHETKERRHLELYRAIMR